MANRDETGVGAHWADETKERSLGKLFDPVNTSVNTSFGRVPSHPSERFLTIEVIRRLYDLPLEESLRTLASIVNAENQRGFLVEWIQVWGDPQRVRISFVEGER